jgi:hypothetical protein
MSVVLGFLIAKFQKKLLENHQILHEVPLVNQKYIEGCKCLIYIHILWLPCSIIWGKKCLFFKFVVAIKWRSPITPKTVYANIAIAKI